MESLSAKDVCVLDAQEVSAVVNGLLGTDVPADQPLMEAGLDSIGAYIDHANLRSLQAPEHLPRRRGLRPSVFL